MVARFAFCQRIVFVCVILVLLCSNQWAFGMPPHPDLEKQFREGKIALPDFIANPDILRQKGIDQPLVRRPGLREKLFEGAPAQGPSGNFKALALLVDFSDKVHQVSASYFDTLIFGTGTGTVRDYYDEVSYGTLTIVTVHLPSATGWRRAPRTYSYYVNGQNGLGAYPQNAQKLVEDVVDAANSVVDFSQYDNNGDGYVDALVVVHAGPGAELTGNSNDIWSHMWGIAPRLKDGVYISPYSMQPEYWLSPGDMTLGVYCHELGHVLGLPDLYDYDYSSEGVGNWSLMAGGSWNGPGHLGGSPAHLDAWSRIQLDFAAANVISEDTAGVSVAAVENTPQIYYVWNCGASNHEYFLMENRQAIGYDAALPNSGLLIWHVDEDMPDNDTECLNQQNCNCTSHYKVALEQADGKLSLEYGNNRGNAGDSYPGSTNNRAFDLPTTPNSGSYADCDSQVAITNISNSGATMTADVSVCYVPNLTWDTTFGGPEADGAESVQQTTDGGYIIAGWTTSYGAGGYDAWLIKTDVDGNKQWDKTFGGLGYDIANSVQQTTDGGYIVAGITASSGAGGYDAWLIKTDANGNKQWDKTFGGSNGDSGYCVQQTTDGGYIIAGVTDPSGVGYNDAWLIKTDANGNKLWDKTFGESNYDDQAYSVQQTTDGGYVIAGYTYSYGAGNYDAWVIKTNVNGFKFWDKTFGGANDDRANGVRQTTDGGYIISGYTSSSGAGGYDTWLIKADVNGYKLWDKTFGGSSDDFACSVQKTTDGGYIIAGYTYSYGAGGYDAWLIETDVDGNQLWNKTFGGSSDDFAYSAQQTTDGGYIIAASTSSSGAGSADVWLIKTNALVTVSGYVSTSGGAGISGVTMNGLPGNPLTGADGYYSASVSGGWSGAVTPTKSNYTFSPASLSYSNLTSDQTNQDYTGSLAPVTLTFKSNASHDGWVMESTETSNVGGSKNSTVTGAGGLRVGDDYGTVSQGERQYKSIVSFDTSSIPDGATILSATLKLKRGGLTGTDPFTTHGSCYVDIKKGRFGKLALEPTDFQAAATATQVATMSDPTTNGSISTGTLNASGLAAINKIGYTQLRLYFSTDDNDDDNDDLLKFYPGDNATPANRPLLEVTYQP